MTGMNDVLRELAIESLRGMLFTLFPFCMCCGIPFAVTCVYIMFYTVRRDNLERQVERLPLGKQIEVFESDWKRNGYWQGGFFRSLFRQKPLDLKRWTNETRED